MTKKYNRGISEAERYRTDPVYRAAKQARNRASYRRHKEARLAWGRAWAERNHEQVLRQAALRYWRTDPRNRFALRANRKAAFYGRPEDVLDWVTIPAGPWLCAYCGVGCESWDHVEPLVLGGLNQASNLVPSCLPCNQLRTAKMIRARVPLKTHCKRGHSLSGDNIRLDGKGIRRCKACAAVYRDEARQRVA